jgi:hypothetical protein
MSKVEKLLIAMRNNPAGDWTIEDVRRVAAMFGLISARPGSGSSHETFSFPGGTALDRITIPDHGRINKRYIAMLLALIDRLPKE